MRARWASEQHVDDRGRRAGPAGRRRSRPRRRRSTCAAPSWRTGRAGCSANGSWSKGPPSVGCAAASTSTSVGRADRRHAMTVDGAWQRRVRILGQASRCRRVVEREHVGAQTRRRAMAPVSRSRALRLPRAPCGTCQSASTAAWSARKTPGVSAHSSTGLFEPVEVAPPERLVLAAVVAARGRDHRDGPLLGCPRVEVIAGEAGQRDGPRRRPRRPDRSSRTGCGPSGGTP